MNENEKLEIISMLVVIYEKLQKLENPSSVRMTSPQTLLDELRKKAEKIQHQMFG